MIKDLPDVPDPSAELLRRWQEDNDCEALEKLVMIEVALLRSRVRRRGRGMSPAFASTCDVANEAVMNWIGRGGDVHFDNERALRAYLWTAAWRLLVKRITDARRKVYQLDSTRSQGVQTALATTGGIGDVGQRDMNAALEVAINVLPEQDRDIIRLVYLDQRSIEDAASNLGISKDAANMRIVRARRKLAAKIHDWSKLIA